jgi:hypothetical protein
MLLVQFEFQVYVVEWLDLNLLKEELVQKDFQILLSNKIGEINYLIVVLYLK